MPENLPLKIIFNAIDKTGNAFAKLRFNLTSAAELAGKATKGLALMAGAIGGFALKEAADFEALELKFRSMTGSVEEGQKVTEKLAKFAASTPFDLKGLSSSATTLLAFGTTTDQLTDQMTILGDISAGVGSDISELITPFGRIQASGRATLEEINKFEDRGIPVIKTIAEASGRSYNEIRKSVSQGKISFEVIDGALKRIRADKFLDFMAIKADSFWGKISNIGDNMSLMLAKLGKIIMEVFDVKASLDGIIELLAATTEWLESIDTAPLIKFRQDFMAVAGTILDMGGAILDFFGGPVMASLHVLIPLLTVGLVGGIQAATIALIGLGKAFMATPFGPWYLAAQVLVSAILLIIKHWDYLHTKVANLTADIKEFAGVIGDFFNKLQGKKIVKKFETEIIPVAAEASGSILTTAGNAAARVSPSISSIAQAQGFQRQRDKEMIIKESTFTNNAKADLGIKIDVVNNKVDLKSSQVEGFNFDKSNLKLGKVAQEGR